MPAPQPKKKFFYVSAALHAVILLILILGFDFTEPMAVIENTNKNDIISAVVLGDSAKSKILPQQAAPAPQSPVKPAIKPEIKPAPPKPEPKTVAEQKPLEKDVIALEAVKKKKLAEEKAKQLKKQQDLFAKELLADIKKQSDKHKKANQAQLKNQFEKSLRQQLLNEEIMLKGTQNRQAQGVINKYKALIIQAISEQWRVPTQANKKLYCELMIRLAPGGVVLDVQIMKTSGDPSLDSSAYAAVLKASPLPVPSDPNQFDAFRQFVLKVRPETILGDNS